MVTIDTNVLVYAFDHRFPAKREAAMDIVSRWRALGGPIGLQVVGEAFRVLTRRLNAEADVVQAILSQFVLRHPSFTANRASLLTAMELAATGRLSFWDANLLSAAEAAGCTHILSEDMADGFRLGRLEVVSAFAEDAVSPRAGALLSS